MKSKRLLILLSILLVMSLILSGCPPFQRPAPEPRPAPDQQPPPETRQDPQDIRRPNQDPTRPQPDQPGPDATDLANRVADIATDVEGVDDAVVVVISNLAMVGITLEDGAEGREVEIKQEVSSTIEDREPGIVNAYVSADPDIIRQLEEISAGIQRGEPISTFFDQITEVLQRMRAETNEN
ncbi:YhcN/YlaJ family sporulation lipoprotein [Dethiobacter alkaliphilus]|uniref:YhcN/YlaJ family sporulation lipoprotein n=1 Tax=Dethiobacter alkaliphilus TaxID=427926 RepID=UPI002226CB06|nr:YhcN/YlaJ family sporulation lipoprotein [Dethiobacter alkaliphilus]MCW3489570.1 YhcN/YlaJ family sporulation lipoprotein [Dethiobacter alkaliphilus]